MVACRVRSDPESHGMRRLQSAGHAVRVATERLVKEASDKAAAEDERLLVISDRMVSGIAQVCLTPESITMLLLGYECPRRGLAKGKRTSRGTKASGSRAQVSLRKVS